MTPPSTVTVSSPTSFPCSVDRQTVDDQAFRDELVEQGLRCDHRGDPLGRHSLGAHSGYKSTTGVGK